jgi:hypothetical protein
VVSKKRHIVKTITWRIVGTLDTFLLSWLITGSIKGDTILVGRFKNKRTKVKTIEYDEFGMPIINGRPACTFRLVKNPR